jgi:hypothetical protein
LGPALLLSFFILATSIAHAQSSDPLAPFGWFKDMAGSCWTGILPDGKTTDTQCYTVQYGRLLRGTIKVHGGAPADDLEGESIYAWNAKADRVQYALWTSNGAYGTGEMYAEGEWLIFPPANANSPGATRMVWNRIDADTFVVIREKRDGKAWSKLSEVTYRRSGEIK